MSKIWGYSVDSGMDYDTLLANVKEKFNMDEQYAKECIAYWIEVGMIIKEEANMLHEAYYRIGKLPTV